MGSTRYHEVRRTVTVPVMPSCRHQRGTIAVLFAGLVFVIYGFCGLALDLGQMYNRKAEMQSAADTLALAAAIELNGTSAGITSAVARATARMTADPPSRLTYQYSKESMTWSDTAIRFSSSPQGEWKDAGAAMSDASNMLYVRIDTKELDPAYGRVNTFFIQALTSSATANVSAVAIAGRSSINVAPLAVCALDANKASNRSGELVEYGFRRGVSYELINKSNANTVFPSDSFLINPYAPPGKTGAAPSSNLSIVKPFVCTGSMQMSRVTGGTLTVESPFPIAQLFEQLNSRFDTYVAPCHPLTAPPDFNVKSYLFKDTTLTPTYANVPWMGSAPFAQTVQTATATFDKYGPLWSYAKPAKYSSYVPNSPEPTNGYSTFSATKGDWSALYSPGPTMTGSATTAIPGYPANTPYMASSGAMFKAPPSGRKGVRQRRVLNVPLLACPVPGNTANILAIGKFFMTVPASSGSLSAEFGGLVQEHSLGGQVELYR